MKLQDALRAAADYLHLNGDELVQFAEETPDYANVTYGGMSIDREEAQFLFALTRGLKPESTLEIGVYEGVSSLFLLDALKAIGSGRLVSVDVVDRAVYGFSDKWEFRVADATTADLPAADFVYEDSDHQLPAAATILTKVKALNPRVVVSHDYYSHEVYQDNVGFQVKQAFDGVFGTDVLGVRWNKAPRGFGLWLNPDFTWGGFMQHVTLDAMTEPVIEDAPPAKKPAPRKRTAKKVAK